MKVMLTGGNGMLGRTIAKTFSSNIDVIQTDLPEVDITSKKSLELAVEKYNPDIIIHCAAMTDVDKCELEKEKAFMINSFGTSNVAKICSLNNIRLISISTDYVFEGNSDYPYNEFDNVGNTQTVYGRSKFAGEEQIRMFCNNYIIVRISWLYGHGGPSFVHTMKNMFNEEIKVVNDQIGNPTSAISVADKLEKMISMPDLCGTFHLTCEGEATWYDFAKEIFRLLKIDKEIKPCSTSEFPRIAARPHNSRLDNMMLRFNKIDPMPHWKKALKEFIEIEFK